jgi:hypothetical protein
MRLRLWGSQALGHSDATGCFRRAENGIWAHWLDLVWGQGKRGNLASPVGRILGLMAAGMGLVVVMAGSTERPSNESPDSSYIGEGLLHGSPRGNLNEKR